ncbi:MAG TPA: hypothetical protein DHV26_14515 [Cytophagales bacterium]|nr:hypothetical protein [Cytophagales bacterium]HRG10296.1 hypothetical protein [Cyclobacteriaceae bacterium]
MKIAKLFILGTILLSSHISAQTQNFFELEIPKNFEMFNQEIIFSNDGYGILKMSGLTRIPQKNSYRTQWYYYISPDGGVLGQFSCVECFLDYKGTSYSDELTYIYLEGSLNQKKGNYFLKFEKKPNGVTNIGELEINEIENGDEFYFSFTNNNQYYRLYKNSKESSLTILRISNNKVDLVWKAVVKDEILKRFKKNQLNVYLNDVIDFDFSKLNGNQLKFVDNTLIIATDNYGVISIMKISESGVQEFEVKQTEDISDLAYYISDTTILLFKSIFDLNGRRLAIELRDLSTKPIAQTILTEDEKSIAGYKSIPIYQSNGDTVALSANKLGKQFIKKFNGSIQIRYKESKEGNLIITILNESESVGMPAGGYGGVGGPSAGGLTVGGGPSGFYTFTNLSVSKTDLKPIKDSEVITPNIKLVLRKKELDLSKKSQSVSYSKSFIYLSYQQKKENKIVIEKIN